MAHYEITEQQFTNLHKYVEDLPTKFGMPIIEFLRNTKRVEDKPVEEVILPEVPKEEAPKKTSKKATPKKK